MPITTFFPPRPDLASLGDSIVAVDTLENAISLLGDVLKAKISSKWYGGLSTHDAKRYLAVQAYFVKLSRGENKIASSREVMSEISPQNSVLRYSRRVREWSMIYLDHLF